MEQIFRNSRRGARKKRKAEVDAADTDLQANGPDSSECSLMTFRLAGDAQPDALPRVASQLYIFNSPPEHFLLQRLTDDTFEIEIAILGASEQQVEAACRKFQQLTCVSRVEVVAADGTQVFPSKAKFKN
jgi:hypothetical protein